MAGWTGPGSEPPQGPGPRGAEATPGDRRLLGRAGAARGAGDPDHLPEHEPRLCRGAALAYSLDEPPDRAGCRSGPRLASLPDLGGAPPPGPAGDRDRRDPGHRHPRGRRPPRDLAARTSPRRRARVRPRRPGRARRRWPGRRGGGRRGRCSRRRPGWPGGPRLEGPAVGGALAVLLEGGQLDLGEVVGVVDPAVGDLDLDLAGVEVAARRRP